MSDCLHFWSAWYMVAPKVAERRCNYCNAVEHQGAEIGDTEDVAPVVVNPEAIGDPDQAPIVELPAGFTDLFGIGGSDGV